MSTSSDFFPRQIGDRESQKFGADNIANAPSTLVIIQVGGKVQDTTYSNGDDAILNFDTQGRLRTSGSVTIAGKDIDTITQVTTGTITFGQEPTNDDWTVEKGTGASTLSIASLTQIHPDSLYLLSVERPSTSTFYPGDLTINTYNVVDHGTGDTDVLHTVQTISSAVIKTNRNFIIQGLFVGQREANLGFKYAADVATTAVIKYKIFRL